MVVIYFRIFLELDLVRQTGMQQNSKYLNNYFIVKQVCKKIQIFESLDFLLNMYVSCFKHVTLVLGSMAHSSN
jgi:hypothetical protein